MAVLFLLGNSGCEHHAPDELADAIYMGERPVAMRGSDLFFNGQIAAIVTISRGIGRGYAHAGASGRRRGRIAESGPDDSDSSSQQKLNALPSGVGGPQQPNELGGAPGTGLTPGQAMTPGGAPMPGGVSQMPGQLSGAPGMGGGAPDIAGAFAGGDSDDDAARAEQEAAIAYLRAKAAIGSPLPPVTLHLWISNLGGKPVEVEADTFNSDLGNFAVEPDTITVPPHEMIQPEPMISQLGVTSDVIPVTVSLKLNGRTETKTILVRNIINTFDTGN